tara:strand:- start:20853 stop:21539 length:687 start_codon:yes stop_codon:yes gene_type:complete
MKNDFYIVENYITKDNFDKIFNENLGDHDNFSVTFNANLVDNEYSMQFRKEFDTIKFDDIYQYRNDTIESISQVWFTRPLHFFNSDWPLKEKITSWVSKNYNIPKDKLGVTHTQIQIYPPGSHIEAHSDKSYDDEDDKICAILIPLNSMPENASGGLLVGRKKTKKRTIKFEEDMTYTKTPVYQTIFEYRPKRGDMVVVDFNSEATHEVTPVVNWFRFMLTCFIKKLD